MNTVLLRCESGHTFEPNGGVTIGPVQLGDPCPLCHPPEPTYGTLDVETAADWLRGLLVKSSSNPCSWENLREGSKEDYRRQARGVIRAMDMAHRRGSDGLDRIQSRNAAGWVEIVGSP